MCTTRIAQIADRFYNAAVDVSDDELLGLHLASALLGPSNVQEQLLLQQLKQDAPSSSSSSSSSSSCISLYWRSSSSSSDLSPMLSSHGTTNHPLCSTTANTTNSTTAKPPFECIYIDVMIQFQKVAKIRTHHHHPNENHFLLQHEPSSTSAISSVKVDIQFGSFWKVERPPSCSDDPATLSSTTITEYVYSIQHPQPQPQQSQPQLSTTLAASTTTATSSNPNNFVVWSSICVTISNNNRLI
jgi:hypothetical protein